MIYQLSQKPNTDFLESIQALMDNGKFCFNKNTFYLYTDKPEIADAEIIKDYFNIDTEITSKNYFNIHNDMCKKWCREKIEQDLLFEFEQSPEGQRRIQLISSYLDEIEKQKGVTDVANKENSHETGITGTDGTGNSSTAPDDSK